MINELWSCGKLSTHFVSKGWGYEIWMVNNELYCGKILHVIKGKRCSVHYHKDKHETFYIKRGTIKLEYVYLKEFESYCKKYKQYGVNDTWMFLANHRILRVGDTFCIPPNTLHSFIGLSSTSEIIEISTHHEDEDSYRLIKGD